MTLTMSIADARNQLDSLPEALEHVSEQPVIALTRRRKRVLALMSWEYYESLMETLEILADTEFLASLRESIRDVEQGRTVPMEEIEMLEPGPYPRANTARTRTRRRRRFGSFVRRPAGRWTAT